MDELLAEYRAEISALLTTVAELESQLKTAKRDAILEAVEKVPSYAICGSHAGEGGAISAVDVLDLINYANTIGKE